MILYHNLRAKVNRENEKIFMHPIKPNKIKGRSHVQPPPKHPRQPPASAPSHPQARFLRGLEDSPMPDKGMELALKLLKLVRTLQSKIVAFGGVAIEEIKLRLRGVDQLP